MNDVSYAVVIPTVGRSSLADLLHALDIAEGPRPAEIVVVDDRRRPADPLMFSEQRSRVRVINSHGRGPATARNIGLRSVRTEWVAFLDDDVLPAQDWPDQLAADLCELPATVAASQAELVVPVPEGQKLTDAQQNVAALANSRWITADMAYRRAALLRVGGFDQRFRRAFREDADLALRLANAGYELVRGKRRSYHPLRQGGFLESVRTQVGNSDDALMRRRHGRQWRSRIGAGGRLPTHLLTTGTGLLTIGLLATGHRRTALAAAAGWIALTAKFATERVLPGPRTGTEISRMIVTSALIPPAACLLRAVGELRWAATPPSQPPPAPQDWPAAVLFDRDDTLIRDVPYNDNPDLVSPVPGARAVVDRLRAAGIPVGVVSNQSGVARGLISPERLRQVNARVEELLGPMDTWQVCVHGEDDGCGCRKPKPGLVRSAARELGVPVDGCVVIGDTGADMAAARAAGARGVLVPTTRTRAAEIRRSDWVAEDLTAAVDMLLARISQPQAAKAEPTRRSPRGGAPGRRPPVDHPHTTRYGSDNPAPAGRRVDLDPHPPGVCRHALGGEST
jgi:histidinol-phosphate phosphatase family protein